MGKNVKNSTELKIKALRLKSGVGRKETMLKINELASLKHWANETGVGTKMFETFMHKIRKALKKKISETFIRKSGNSATRHLCCAARGGDEK